MKLFHYTNKPFDAIDATKCDGFWMTDIAPTETEMLDQIGAAGMGWVAVVELDNSGEELTNGDNHEVAEQLENEGADYMCNRYDGFCDYAVNNASLVKIIEWIKL